MNLSYLAVLGLSSFVLSLAVGPTAIKYLQRLRAGATIRTDGPQSHLKKAGTPLMGGIIFILPVVLGAIGLLYFHNNWLRPVLGCLVYILGFGFLGFLDDYLKVTKKESQGLKAREKLFGQLLVALAFLAVFVGQQLDTTVSIPFIGFGLDISYLYIPFIILLAMFTSNATNITDGVDGLLAGAMVFSCLSYIFIALAARQPAVAALAALLVGGLLAFLVFNYHPAKVFMGDTGSQALGGALTAFALLTKTELLMIIIGGLYVLEALSVILQVSYFKLTKGRRIFKMSPIHHHFELSGWSELRVVWTFWFISGLFGLLGLLGFANMG